MLSKYRRGCQKRGALCLGTVIAMVNTALNMRPSILIARKAYNSDLHCSFKNGLIQTRFGLRTAKTFSPMV